VSGEVTGVTKRRTAHIASKRLLSRVDAPVSGEAASLTEPLSTSLARKRLPTSVGWSVSCDAAGSLTTPANPGGQKRTTKLTFSGCTVAKPEKK